MSSINRAGSRVRRLAIATSIVAAVGAGVLVPAASALAAPAAITASADAATAEGRYDFTSPLHLFVDPRVDGIPNVTAVPWSPGQEGQLTLQFVDADGNPVAIPQGQYPRISLSASITSTKQGAHFSDGNQEALATIEDNGLVTFPHKIVAGTGDFKLWFTTKPGGPGLHSGPSFLSNFYLLMDVPVSQAPVVDEQAAKEAEAKALAELKVAQEAEAKAAAELKAKEEAETKAAAELKAAQEAEAKTAADLKAKEEAEAAALEAWAQGQLRVNFDAAASEPVKLQLLRQGSSNVDLEPGKGGTFSPQADDQAYQVVVTQTSWPFATLANGSVYFMHDNQGRIVIDQDATQLPDGLTLDRVEGTNLFTFTWHGAAQ